MKSTDSIRQAVSAVVLCAAASAAACGPYYPIIPTPDYFISGNSQKSIADNDREENLRLWQEQTSTLIPLTDIENAVYKDSYATFAQNCGYGASGSENRFYAYIKNTNDREVADLLLTAKRLEKLRADMLSPWYYPAEKETGNDELGDIIDKCRAYKGDRLKDRYALQATRALFAAQKYAECIEYFDSAFAGIPSGNLMRRMAQRYVAGCRSRLGDKESADLIYAEAGDIRSISDSDPLAFMARHNPNAPQLIEYIRDKRCARDTAAMTHAAGIAMELLGADKVTDKGDWNFLLAYFHNEFKDNTPLAREHIVKALRQRFSSENLKDLARAYKMKLNARSGDDSLLAEDLKWAESKTDPHNPDAFQWERRIRNIIYEEWVPRLWKERDYSRAILLCAYADNLEYKTRRQTVYSLSSPKLMFALPDISMTIGELRGSEIFFNPLDYACLSFQLMESLTSEELASVYDRIMEPGSLNDFLRRNIRTDSDYYNELIGTLALREGNYERAEKYLSEVSEQYQRTMNINKEGYLSRDAFGVYPSRWSTDIYGWPCENSAASHDSRREPGAKLEFARKMKEYHEVMEHGATGDERGMARLMYAIGRRNSQEECWALTQYRRGFCSNVFYPSLQYWDDFAESKYPFLYDYVTASDYKKTEEEYNRGIEKALAMLETDEAKAKAEYTLGNLKTVVARYGKTATAKKVRKSCDNWKNWL
ncbi:MAG: hypothetical protein K2J66_07485 [Muribaculaceae bacterium]|nr:hypothetical protein [Muribaculaceae bacterium]